jgi:hypothetical protein
VQLTGTLSKPLSTTSTDSGVDLIFATYWFEPAKTEAIVLKSADCVQRKLLDETLRFDETSTSSKPYSVFRLLIQSGVKGGMLHCSESKQILNFRICFANIELHAL